MKNILLFILIGLAYSSQAQDTSTIQKGTYRWKNEVLMKPCDVEGKPKDKNRIYSKSGQLFKVVERKKDSVVIRILDYTKNDMNENKYNFCGDKFESIYDNKGDKTMVRDESNQAYFLVPNSFILGEAEKEEKERCKMAFGVLNFPFKFRPKIGKDIKADFTGSFNFGAAVGVVLPSRTSNKWKHSILLGYSISNIDLDESSVEENASRLTDTNNFTALSLSVGYMVEFKGVQAGAFIGWDRLSRLNQDTFGWKYQGKPWLSLGIGYAIFSSKGNSKDIEEN